MRWSRIMLVSVLAVFGLSAAVQADEVDNPQYKAWAKFDAGATSTMSADMTAQNGMNLTMEMTRKLVEKADDHLVIEVSTSVTMPGQPPRQTPAHKMTIAAKIDKENVTEDGKEDVKAGDGKTYSCRVMEVKGADVRRPDAKGKIWVNDDVPGGLVKLEGSNGQAQITFLLKSFTTK